MLKAILIDDEPAATKALLNDLEQYARQEVEVIQICHSPLEGLKAINKYQPDLVFLDIMMPGMSGFELLEILGDFQFEVIFITAHNEYAVDAFNISAIHYLQKPVDKNKLVEAIQRVKEKRQQSISNENILQLLGNLKSDDPEQKIGLPTKEGFDFVPIKNIMYCVAEGNYTFIHLDQQKPALVTRSLKLIQQALPEKLFFRVHASHIINRTYLDKYIRGDGGYVLMGDQKSLSVARSKKVKFLHWVGLSDET
jgi:two-component system LytT family response regulator